MTLSGHANLMEREYINIETRGTQWGIEKGINYLSTKTER